MNRLMTKSLQMLQRKSAKALESAKQQLLMYKIEDKKLKQGLEHYAKNWDDTLHPGMIAVACEAVGGDRQEPLPMQVPMLFLTAAIDIHDDIIDGSKIKNGICTVFGKFGRDLALLAGDGMFLKGMAMVYEDGRKLLAETFQTVMSAIEAAFAEAGNAHALEISLRGKVDLDPQEYFRILQMKASIVEAHTRIGALIGKSKHDDVEILGEYGRILGTLITLRDEFVDVFEANELNDRMKNGCLPLPLIYAFRNPRAKKEILEILSKGKIVEKDAESIVGIVYGEKSVQRLKDEMSDLARSAKLAVSSLPKNDSLELLVKATLENIWEAER